MRLGNVLNKRLQLCFVSGVLSLAPAWCADTGQQAAERVRVDVRADKRTGRLVRSVVVEPAVIEGRIVGQPPQTFASAPVSLPLASNPRINELVEQAARQYDVDPLLVHAVIQVESAYNPYAVSPVGAQGLMQLMPETARRLGVRNSFDAEENIRAGVKHLKELQETFKDDRLALAAYNAGAGAVNRYRWIPPYPETQEYVYKVGKKYGEARKAASTQLAKAPVADAKKPETASPAQEPVTRPVEAFVDAEGRLHLRTK